MNDGSCDHRTMRPCWRPAVLLAIVVDIALLTAACSGTSPSGGSGGSSAKGGSASPSATSFPSPSSAGKSQLAYSECMSSHGVPGVPVSFPTSLPTASSSSGPHWKPVQASGPNPGSPQFDAAQQACRSLQPEPPRVVG